MRWWGVWEELWDCDFLFALFWWWIRDWLVWEECARDLLSLLFIDLISCTCRLKDEKSFENVSSFMNLLRAP